MIKGMKKWKRGAEKVGEKKKENLKADAAKCLNIFFNSKMMLQMPHKFLNCFDNINNPLGAKWRGGREKSLGRRADSSGEQGQAEEAAAEEEWDDLSADYTASASLCSDSGARGARPEGIRHTIICIW